jgi:hypothetical protein
MRNLFTKKEVARMRREAVIAESKKRMAVQSPLPVCSLYYPRHGDGEYSHRYVRVLEMNETHVKGFEITSEFDEEPGKPRTYRVDKIEGGARVYILHLAKPAK